MLFFVRERTQALWEFSVRIDSLGERALSSTSERELDFNANFPFGHSFARIGGVEFNFSNQVSFINGEGCAMERITCATILGCVICGLDVKVRFPVYKVAEIEGRWWNVKQLESDQCKDDSLRVEVGSGVGGRLLTRSWVEKVAAMFLIVLVTLILIRNLSQLLKSLGVSLVGH